MKMPNRTIKLFSSPWLERLTRTHTYVPVSIFVIYATCLFVFSIANAGVGYATAIVSFLMGLITFTWTEYKVHRHVFHWKHSTPQGAKFQYTIHGVHHHFPEDKSRLAMPPWLSVSIGTILLLLLKLIVGKYAFAFLSGFFLGYAAYLLVHHMVHAYRPPKNVLRILWKHHFIHHYKDETRAFGVSSPLWDYVYKTLPKS